MCCCCLVYHKLSTVNKQSYWSTLTNYECGLHPEIPVILDWVMVSVSFLFNCKTNLRSRKIRECSPILSLLDKSVSERRNTTT